jgi:hypothetical protein
MTALLTAPDRESLRFFRPIAQRVEIVGASLLTINFVAPRAHSMPARGLNHHKNTSGANKAAFSLMPKPPMHPAGWPFHLQPLSEHACRSSWRTHPSARAIPARCGYLHLRGCLCGCAGAGQQLPGAAMHDLRWWMAGDVLQNSGAGGAVRVACE